MLYAYYRCLLFTESQHNSNNKDEAHFTMSSAITIIYMVDNS